MSELGWWTISGADLLAALRRVELGEPADVVYAEYYANSQAEKVGGNGDD
jgi:hypothetical protein